MDFSSSQSTYQRIYSQPAYVLHTTAYQNTSLLVDAFTAEFGRIRFVAKGAKRLKSTFAGKLQVFTPLLLSWSGRGDLYTLTDADFANFQQRSFLNGQLQLRGSVLLSSYYLNELILRFVTLEDPHPELFYHYVEALDKLLVKQNIESVLRIFEKYLLHETGYTLMLTQDAQTGEDVVAESNYYYALTDIEGPVRAESSVETHAENSMLQFNYDSICVSGKTLLELERGIFSDNETLKQAKILMRSIIAKHLGGEPLKTRTLFQSTIL